MPPTRSTLTVSSSVAVTPHDARTVPGATRFGSKIKVPHWFTWHSWLGRLLWLLVLIGPIWLLDKPLCDLRMHENKALLLGDFRDVTRQFGEPVGIAWMGLVLWFLDSVRRRPLVIALV